MVFINLEVTNRCNLQCKYCCNADGITTKNDESLYFRTDRLENFSNLDFDFTVLITGGEPTLAKDLQDYVIGLGKIDNCKSILIFSNLIQDENYWDSFIGIKGIKKIRIIGSYHAEYRSQTNFVRKAKYISKLDLDLSVQFMFSDTSDEIFEDYKELTESLDSVNLTNIRDEGIYKNEVKHDENYNRFYSYIKVAKEYDKYEGKYEFKGKELVQDIFEKLDNFKYIYNDKMITDLEASKFDNFIGWNCTPLVFSTNNVFTDEELTFRNICSSKEFDINSLNICVNSGDYIKCPYNKCKGSNRNSLKFK